MAITITTNGITTTDLLSFSVQEDATPIDPASSAGGVGQISATLDEFGDSEMLIGRAVLADGTRGKTSGDIKSLNASDGKLSFTADSVLGKFNTDRTAQPYIGTLAGAMQYYCTMVNIDNTLVVDSTIAARSVTYPGFVGNVWVTMKQILAKEQVEMALVYDRIVVRPLRTIVANKDRLTTSGWAIDNNNAARDVEVNYYNLSYGTFKEVYPTGANSDANIYSVGPGETIVVTEQLNASLTSVNQPVASDFVGNVSVAGTSGVYAVSGNDGLPITAAQWLAQGGSVRVRITEDPSIIEITITGASAALPAPFRIAMSSGSSNFYNALRITGTGVSWDKQSVILSTGVPDAATSTQIGVTVDNKFISSYSEALSLGMKTAASYAGLNYTVNGNAVDINRSGVAGKDLVQATISDFNTAYLPGTLISSFNTTWSGQSIAQFNAYWTDQIDLLWENQLFGNAPGARVMYPDANFRIVSATTTEAGVQYNASLDTTLGDFSTKWSSGANTVADFNAKFVGKTIKDYNVVPLRRA
jgi:hypothetical protein